MFFTGSRSPALPPGEQTCCPYLGRVQVTLKADFLCLGQFMTMEEHVEELKCLVSQWYLFQLISDSWPLTTLGLHHFTHFPAEHSLLHIGMSLTFRQDLHKWTDSFCTHIFLGTKVITTSLPCLQNPWPDQGNKVGLLGNMRLDQDVQNVLVWLNRILRAVLFIRLTTEEGK